MENNRTYFMKREAEERAAATRAKGKAREAHEQMAQRYHELAHHAKPANLTAGSTRLRAEPLEQ